MVWTIATIDGGIPVIAAKRDESRRKGDHEAAARHQAWIDRLLEARLYRTLHDLP